MMCPHRDTERERVKDLQMATQSAEARSIVRAAADVLVGVLPVEVTLLEILSAPFLFGHVFANHVGSQ